MQRLGGAFPGDPALEAAVAAWVSERGVGDSDAVLWRVVEALEGVTQELEAVRRAVRERRSVGGGERSAWLEGLVRRFGG